MEIIRLPLDYAGSFQEVVDYDRLYTLGMLTVAARIKPGPNLGGRGPRAPGLPPIGGLPPNPSIFKTP